jgi:hypothetical protein
MYLKTENNNAVLTMIAERPNTAAEVWIRRAQQVPKAVLRPPLLPSVRVFFVANGSIGTG